MGCILPVAKAAVGAGLDYYFEAGVLFLQPDALLGGECYPVIRGDLSFSDEANRQHYLNVGMFT